MGQAQRGGGDGILTEHGSVTQPGKVKWEMSAY